MKHCECGHSHKPEDIRGYGHHELSLRVFNIESLYRIRHSSAHLVSVLKDRFVFTHAQMGVLLGDLAKDNEG